MLFTSNSNYYPLCITGAPVPHGADAVVQVEDTGLAESTEQGEEALIEILSAVKPGSVSRDVS